MQRTYSHPKWYTAKNYDWYIVIKKGNEFLAEVKEYHLEDFWFIKDTPRRHPDTGQWFDISAGEEFFFLWENGNKIIGKLWTAKEIENINNWHFIVYKSQQRVMGAIKKQTEEFQKMKEFFI